MDLKELEEIFNQFDIEKLIQKENLVGESNSINGSAWEYKTEDQSLKIEEDNGKLKVEYNYQPSKNSILKEVFKSYCEELDDDIFVEACEEYSNSNLGRKTLQTLEKNLTEENIKEFVEYVKSALNKRADKLIYLYEFWD